MLATLLAAVLAILKTFPSAEHLDRDPKDLVMCIGGSAACGLWPAVVRAESRMWRAVKYNVTTPMSLDFLEVLALRIVDTASATAPTWDGLKKLEHGAAMFAVAAAFLAELGVAHVAEANFALSPGKLPPLMLAIAALWLALEALHAPVECFQQLVDAHSLLDETDSAHVTLFVDLTKALHVLWQKLPQSAVVAKWNRRQALLGALPAVPSEPLSHLKLLAGEPDVNACPMAADMATQARSQKRSALQAFGSCHACGRDTRIACAEQTTCWDSIELASTCLSHEQVAAFVSNALIIRVS